MPEPDPTAAAAVRLLRAMAEVAARPQTWEAGGQAGALADLGWEVSGLPMVGSGRLDFDGVPVVVNVEVAPPPPFGSGGLSLLQASLDGVTEAGLADVEAAVEVLADGGVEPDGLPPRWGLGPAVLVMREVDARVELYAAPAAATAWLDRAVGGAPPRTMLASFVASELLGAQEGDTVVIDERGDDGAAVQWRVEGGEVHLGCTDPGSDRRAHLATLGWGQDDPAEEVAVSFGFWTQRRPAAAAEAAATGRLVATTVVDVLEVEDVPSLRVQRWNAISGAATADRLLRGG